MIQAVVVRNFAQTMQIVNQHRTGFDREQATLPKDPKHTIDVNCAEADGISQHILIQGTVKFRFVLETNQYQTFREFHKKVGNAAYRA